MPLQAINGIDIAYETSGRPDGRPLVMIMGLATSMAAWPEEFISMLVEAGHFVLRLDNRDVGRSAKIEAGGEPSLERIVQGIVEPPYTLSEMAADTLGLLDHLGIERAHVCGVSMGGMIAQLMAIEHPLRVASLISIMSTTGEADLPTSTPAAMNAMMGMPPQTRPEFQQYMLEMMRTFCDASPEFDPQVQLRLSGQVFDYGVYPQGFFRQMAAIIGSGGRRERLKKVRVPALVIHGDHDTVIPPRHGKDTADAIAGARLLMVPGLGHGLAFPRLWRHLAAAIAAHTADAAQKDGAAASS